ncbi:MAG: type II toxin-antitoxin system RelE/ParE family toxin [Flavobacteriales bacterium]|nr:type II toxin-antitoxin system RelE/ParE family toxin [Flavobacteriales bacterium]
MNYRIKTHPEVSIDIERGIVNYKNIDSSLALKFTLEIEEHWNNLVQNPNHFQIRYKNVRVSFLKIFPYGIHYIFSEQTIYIIAIFNTSENPDKWNKRLYKS